ncbi:MAG TPA: hypothetical protein P5572_04015 [Phycisphaerae bacterium]|nr:hypothetical protein [Phycisphaerae bacterium]
MKAQGYIRASFCVALASAAFAADARAQATLTLNVEPAGTGFVGRFPNASDFVDGDDVTVTATPAPGYEFVGWIGDIESADSSMTFPMAEDTELTAVFAELEYDEGTVLHTLTAFVEPSGAGTIVRDPALFEYAEGNEVTLTAYAGEGFVFTGWSGDLPEGADATDPTLVLTMDADLDVRANFSAGLVLDGEDGNNTTACGATGVVAMTVLCTLMLSMKLGRSRRW